MVSSRVWALGAAAVGGAVAVARAGRRIPEAIGGTASGERLARMRRSPQFSDGVFHNRGLTHPPTGPAMADTAKRYVRGEEQREPSRPIPLDHPAYGTGEGVQVTWFGHSSALVEIDGTTILLDPVWSDRCSPSAHVGPKRLHPMPVAIADLPQVDAVVISHDHYDHLDMDSIIALRQRSSQTLFVVPLGVGAHLERWAVPAEQIIELDWDEDTKVGGVRLVCTPAQHFSGRGLKRDGTLWSSWVLAGESHRVFYSGDGGYFDGFAAIGEEHGPFDASLVQVGAYDPAWSTIHMTPEEGVRTHLDVRADLLIPVHWCTFVLALHDWSEPVDRLLAACEREDVSVAVPRPGQTVRVGEVPPHGRWWDDLV